MTRTAFKAAASTLIVAMTMTGFSGQSDAMRRFNASAHPAQSRDRPPTPSRRPRRRAVAGQLDDAHGDGAGGGAEPARRRLSPAARRHLSEVRPLRFGARRPMPTCSSSIPQPPRRAQHRPDPDRPGQSATPRWRGSTISPARAGRPMSASLMRSPASPAAPCNCSNPPPARRARRRAPARISLSLMPWPATGAGPRDRRAGLSPADLPARMAQWAALRPARRRRDPGRRLARRHVPAEDPASRSALALAPEPPPTALAAADPAPRRSRSRRPSRRPAAPAPAAGRRGGRRPRRPPSGCRPRHSYQRRAEAPVAAPTVREPQPIAPAARGPRPICRRRSQPGRRPSRR